MERESFLIMCLSMKMSTNIPIDFGVNLTVQDLLHQDARIQDLYFNISEMKLPITSLFSVQIMSYLGASDIIYSDVIDSFI